MASCCKPGIRHNYPSAFANWFSGIVVSIELVIVFIISNTNGSWPRMWRIFRSINNTRTQTITQRNGPNDLNIRLKIYFIQVELENRDGHPLLLFRLNCPHIFRLNRETRTILTGQISGFRLTRRTGCPSQLAAVLTEIIKNSCMAAQTVISTRRKLL